MQLLCSHICLHDGCYSASITRSRLTIQACDPSEKSNFLVVSTVFSDASDFRKRALPNNLAEYHGTVCPTLTSWSRLLLRVTVGEIEVMKSALMWSRRLRNRR
jgi:hypothetical protein